MTTPWSDTPPSEAIAGWYWVRARRDGDTQPAWFTGRQWICDGSYYPDAFAKLHQFGPAVLSAEDTVALTAEVERLRAELATLRELRVFDWKLKERLEKRLSKYEDVRYVTAQGQGAEVSVPAEELDQLRAAAAELAEIKRAWGMAAKDL